MNASMHRVRLGRLGSNDPIEYPFPTRKAAEKFASNSATLHPGRVVIVKSPTGAVIKRYGPSKKKKKLRRIR